MRDGVVVVCWCSLKADRVGKGRGGRGGARDYGAQSGKVTTLDGEKHVGDIATWSRFAEKVWKVDGKRARSKGRRCGGA